MDERIEALARSFYKAARPNEQKPPDSEWDIFFARHPGELEPTLFYWMTICSDAAKLKLRDDDARNHSA